MTILEAMLLQKLRMLLLLTLGLICQESMGKVIATKSNWDTALLSVKLKDVHLRADSLTEAWQKQACGSQEIRSVLYLTKAEVGKFSFDAENCTVKDVLMALVEAYPDYTFTQDPEIGTIWLHPKETLYASILTQQVRVSRSQPAVPMVTGALDGLSEFRFLGVASSSSEGTAALNTYDYPVDLPDGIWSVREIINACCAASLRTSFFLELRGDRVFITPNMIGARGEKQPSMTSIAYFQSECDNSLLGAPTEDQVISALSSSNAIRRQAALQYVQMCWANMSPEALVTHAPSDERGLWVAVGMTSIMARTEFATFTPGLMKIQEILNKGTNASISPGLRVIAVMECARLGASRLGTINELQSLGRKVPQRIVTEASDNLTVLESVATTPLSSADTANIYNDMIRVLRYSKPVRDKLRELNPPWAGFSKTDIDALESTEIFSLP